MIYKILLYFLIQNNEGQEYLNVYDTYVNAFYNLEKERLIFSAPYEAMDLSKNIIEDPYNWTEPDKDKIITGLSQDALRNYKREYYQQNYNLFTS